MTPKKSLGGILLTVCALFLGSTAAANTTPKPLFRGDNFFVAHSNRVAKQTQRVSANVTFAMIMTRFSGMPEALSVGSLYQVVAGDGATVLIQDHNTQYTVPQSAVRELTVSPQPSTPVKMIGGKVILGFADGTTSQYASNFSDPLSLFSPLSYNVGSGGTVAGNFPAALSEQAHQRGIQVWPILASGFNPIQTNAILQSEQAKWNILTSVLAKVEQDGVDGINLDFEDMEPNDAPLLTQFAQDLRDVLHTTGKGLSIDVTPPSSDPHWGIVYNRPQLAQISDYLVVMTYDEHYAGDATPGSVASLPWMESSITSTIDTGVAPSKVLVGIPFYARTWYKVGGSLQSSAVAITDEQGLSNSSGSSSVWNAHTQQDILNYTQHGTSFTMWLENQRSLSERAQYVEKTGLAGVAIWQLELGTTADVIDLSSQF